MGLGKLVRYIEGLSVEVLFHTLHYYWAEKYRSLYRGFVTGSTVCFLPFPTARLHGNWKRGNAVDLISGFRVSVNCGVHFEITRMCDISPTSSKGNRNLLHFISGILRFKVAFEDNKNFLSKILAIFELLLTAHAS